jgi:hypothetical protein
MAEKVVVVEALAFEGIVYGPGMEIPHDVWLRVAVRDRNKLLNTASCEEDQL